MPPRIRRTQTFRATNPSPVVDPIILPFLIDTTQIQNLMAQGITIALAAYEAARDKPSRNSGNDGGIPIPNRNNPKSSTYKGIMTPQTEKKQTRDSKRKLPEESREDSQPHKIKTESVTIYTIDTNTPTSFNSYQGNAPLCPKCNRHRMGECFFCTHCKIPGHTAKYCRKLAATTTLTPAAGGSRNCYECNQSGHFRKDCPKLKNRGGRGESIYD